MPLSIPAAIERVESIARGLAALSGDAPSYVDALLDVAQALRALEHMPKCELVRVTLDGSGSTGYLTARPVADALAKLRARVDHLLEMEAMGEDDEGEDDGVSTGDAVEAPAAVVSGLAVCRDLGGRGVLSVSCGEAKTPHGLCVRMVVDLERPPKRPTRVVG